MLSIWKQQCSHLRAVVWRKRLRRTCIFRKEDIIPSSMHPAARRRARPKVSNVSDVSEHPFVTSSGTPAGHTGTPSTAEPVASHLRGIPHADIRTPADRYAELFVAVQMSRVFPDSKTFADCAPRMDPHLILAQYRELRDGPGFNLSAFVHARFDLPTSPAQAYVADPNNSMAEHIDQLWPVLTREPQLHPEHSSLLPLPEPYVVPGGRFGEIYYWDSYFTMLGLAASGRRGLLRSMANNFAYLIDTYGHVPNGNRTYYLSRSQPPVFALMVELFEEEDVHIAPHYLPQLRSEHAFWMRGADNLPAGQAAAHVVRLPDGRLVNRYWDERDTPRDESYREDVETAEGRARPASEIYRDLRAGAASGWDFSSRWLDDPSDISTIRTTAIVPVDLNAFLYKLEVTIADLSQKVGDAQAMQHYQDLAVARREVMNDLMWDGASGTYRDYDWRVQQRRELTAATVVPLFVNMASKMQADGVAAAVQNLLLAPGGLSTTLLQSGQQWDQPNGWAPLQWMAMEGLIHYGYDSLAREIGRRWILLVDQVYQRDCKLVEKYDISSQYWPSGGGGGEYPLQDGFGWTNGLVRRLLRDYGPPEQQTVEQESRAA